MNSLPSILAISIRGFYSFPLFSRRGTASSDEDEDPFSAFLDPGLRSNTKQFVKTYFQLAKGSTSPLHALRGRHTVTFVGVNKGTVNPQHETFTIRVFDGDTDKTHMFIIKCTASTRSIESDDDIFEYFTQCPDSKSVLETIQMALQDMSGAASKSTSLQPFKERAFTSESLSESQVLLLPSTNHITSSNSIPAPQSTFIYWSLAKAVPVAAARSSARSSPIQLEAEDMILGVVSQDLGKSIRQYDPEGLSLFDVVLLAHVVYKLAPTYALFENQSYWFANVMFEVIPSLFPSKSQTSPLPVSPPMVRLPNDYSPKEADWWCGVLINNPRVVAAVVSIAKFHFKSQHARYLEKVILFYF